MDMNFDVKAKIEELVEKLQKDPALLKRFQSDPIQTVEGLLGVDLPDDKLQPLVAGIKALGAANDPAKLKGAMAWNIVGAVASFLGLGLVTTVLCIIVAVFANKDKAALEAGYFYAQPPAQPQPQPPYCPYQ